MLHTRDLTGTIEIDGQKYIWTLLREPQWCHRDGWRGMTVSVRKIDGQREAVLEFPMPRRGNGSGNLIRPKINDAIAANCVRAALGAGWEPTSRGKTQTFMVDSSGS